MIPTRLWQTVQGGKFVGFMIKKHQVVAIVVSPLSTEIQERNGNGTTTQTLQLSFTDGEANTAKLLSTSPAAQYCKQLTVNGFQDWYLPSICELFLALGKSTINIDTIFYKEVPVKMSVCTSIPETFTHNTAVSIAADNEFAFESHDNSVYWTSTTLCTDNHKHAMLAVYNMSGTIVPFSNRSCIYVRPFRSFVVI